MNLNDMSAALRDAEQAIANADRVAGKLAEILTNQRLRMLSSYELRRLKRELTKFDALKCRWKA